MVNCRPNLQFIAPFRVRLRSEGSFWTGVDRDQTHLQEGDALPIGALRNELAGGKRRVDGISTPHWDGLARDFGIEDLCQRPRLKK